MTRTAAYWIERLGLVPHPEGGWFRETYRARDAVTSARDGATRAASTAIYFLLADCDFSALHRLACDEVWHFYDGAPLVMTLVDERGRLSEVLLGPEPERGETLQTVVPARCWFGARLATRDAYALVGCTVAPGFEPSDFELADRAALVARYPEHRALIETLTR